MENTGILSARGLRNMVVPLFLEQLLVILVGLADTLVISYTGEAAVSGVSLVNQFNTIFLYLFTALASGGAVVISQYIGSRNHAMASRASGQLLMFSTVFSGLLSAVVLLFGEPLMRLLFGGVEPEVMDACMVYLRISVYSYPMLAVYNAGASLCRSLGRTGTTMYLSLASNVINVVGNIIGVFVLKAGVAGVAWPSFIARTFSAVVITVLCYRQRQVKYENSSIFCWDGALLKKVLGIAIPNGVESGIFQLTKVALSGIVALFGTYQIAANGIAQSIWGLAALSGIAFSPVFITVIGQCMGSGDTAAAEVWFRRLLKINVGISLAWNALVLALTPLLLRFYAVSPETESLIFRLVVIHNVFNSLAFPFAGALGSGLRAAGDVKFTMYISVFTTVVVRLALSVVFGVWMNLGVIGIAFAMCADWTVKGTAQYIRMKKGAWKKFRVI